MMKNSVNGVENVVIALLKQIAGNIPIHLMF